MSREGYRITRKVPHPVARVFQAYFLDNVDGGRKLRAMRLLKEGLVEMFTNLPFSLCVRSLFFVLEQTGLEKFVSARVCAVMRVDIR